MNEVFVIRNQLGHYWGKKKVWVDGSDNRTVVRLRHRDEAVNSLFELSSKDFELRGEIIEAQLSAKGEPEVEASDIPLPDTDVDEPLETTQVLHPEESSAAGS
ncbi:MAG: hypothetical protein ACJAZ0_001549 [Halioglobus sp.]|jgi:hypothetical protein